MKSSLFLYSYKNKHELCSLSDTLITKWSSLPQRWDQFSVTCNMCCCLLSAHAKTCLRRDYENRTAHTRLRKYTRKNYNIQIQEILPSYWSDQMMDLPPSPRHKSISHENNFLFECARSRWRAWGRSCLTSRACCLRPGRPLSSWRPRSDFKRISARRWSVRQSLKACKKCLLKFNKSNDNVKYPT